MYRIIRQNFQKIIAITFVISFAGFLFFASTPTVLAATDFTITTPTSAIGAGTPSRAITLTVTGGSVGGSTASFALTDGGAGGVFYPASPVTIAANSSVGATTQFVYIAPVGATGTITIQAVATGGISATHTLALPVGVATNITKDTFSGTAGTSLGSHTNDSGNTYTKMPGFGGADIVLTGAGQARPSGSAGDYCAYVTNGVTPTSSEYDVSTNFSVLTAGDAYVALFTHTKAQSGGYGYNFGYKGNLIFGSRYGVSTAVLWSSSYSAATSGTMTLSVRNIGGHQYLFYLINGVSVHTPVQDDNLTSANAPGYFEENVNAPTTSNGVQASNYIASNSDWASSATSYTLTGPSSATENQASSNFTVTPNGSYTGTITPSDGGVGGTFTPTNLTFSSSSVAQTFTYTPITTGSITISVSSSPSITNPSSITLTSTAPVPADFTITTPTSAIGAGTPSRAITLTVTGGSVGASTASFALTDGGAGGVFYPASPVTIAANSSAGATTQFVYIPASNASGTITLQAVATGGISATHTLALPIGSATIITKDTFAGTAGTSLGSHTNDSGNTYTKMPGFGTADILLNGTGSVYSAGSAGGYSGYVTAGVTPSSTEYDVSANFSKLTADAEVALFSHAQAVSAGYGYNFGYNGTAFYGSRYGVSTAVLFTTTVSYSSGTMTLSIRNISGNQYLFYLVNGVSIHAPILDNNLALAYSPGFFQENINTPSSSNGTQLSNYIASNSNWTQTIGMSSISPAIIPSNHSGNITLTLSGTGTSWVQGTTNFTISGVSNVTKISQNITNPTTATVVITTGSGTGTLSVSDGTNSNTITVATPTLSVSPTSGTVSTTPTVTLTGTNTIWNQETASSLFSVSGGTGAGISSVTIASNTTATAVLTTGTATGTLTITDNSTGATTTFTASPIPPGLVSITNSNLVWSPYTWRFNGSTYAQSVPTGGAYVKVAFTGSTLALGVDTTNVPDPSSDYVDTYIDGATNPIAMNLSQVSSGFLAISSSLSSGNHYAIIYFASSYVNASSRWNGTTEDVLRITKIQLASDGSGNILSLSSTPLAKKNKKVLILGDSITEAYGTTGNRAEYGYAGILGQELGVEYGQIGYASLGWNKSGNGSVPQFYDLTTPSNSVWRNFDSLYSRLNDNSNLTSGFVDGTPDAVFINMGGNDANAGNSLSNLTTKTTDWITDTRQTIGQTPAIFVISPFAFGNTSNGSDSYVSPTAAASYKAALRAGITNYQSSNPSDSRVYFLDLDTSGYNTVIANSSDGIHPNNAGSSILGGGLEALAYPYIFGSLSSNTSSIIEGSTGNIITITGTNTSWTIGSPGIPTFTISGGSGSSITAQTVTSSTSVTLTVTAGSSTGTLTITDPSTGATIIVTVTKATPTLSITNSPVTYNATPQSATVVGSVSGVVSNIKYAGSSTVPTNAGTYAITADFAPTDSTNYNSLTGASAGSFVINLATQATLAFAGQTVSYPTTFAALSTTGGSGSGAVTYAVTTAGTAGCSIAGTTLSYTSVGTCGVTATKATDSNYNSGSSSEATFTINAALSSTKAITAFDFNGLTLAVVGTIDETGKTIALTVPYGTAVTALVPTITITGSSVSPVSLVAQNFTSPVTYTVTAANASTQPYIVTVTVAPIGTHTITASAGANGSISPTGSVSVNNGSDQAFTITPNSGYHIDTVTADSVVVSAKSPYTFTNVTTDHTISATFVADPIVSHSGSGGMIIGWNNLPKMPAGGFKIFVNSGASTTTNRIVNLNFNAGADVEKMAISLTGDFADASQENYSPTKQIDLCSKFGVIKNPTCPNGKYTIYIKFYTTFGVASPVVTSSITLATGTTNTTKYNFTRNLSLHATGADVKALQQFLNANGFVIAKTGAGSPGKETNLFGSLTYKALVKFQKSIGWSGTGFFGPMTREYIANH